MFEVDDRSCHLHSLNLSRYLAKPVIFLMASHQPFFFFSSLALNHRASLFNSRLCLLVYSTLYRSYSRPLYTCPRVTHHSPSTRGASPFLFLCCAPLKVSANSRTEQKEIFTRIHVYPIASVASFFKM